MYITCVHLRVCMHVYHTCVTYYVCIIHVWKYVRIEGLSHTQHTDHTHLKAPGSKVDDVGTALQHVPLSSAPTTSSVLTKVRMRACDWGISALVWRGILQCVCMFVCVRVCVCAGGCVCVRERERGYKHTHTHLHTTIHTW